MDPLTIAFIVALFELALKYGVPGAVEIIKQWEIKNPTLKDIEALKLRVLRPESYFNNDS